MAWRWSSSRAHCWAILGDVNGIGTTISTIADYTAKQVETLGEVSATMGEIDQVTQQNAAMVEQTSAARAMAEESQALWGWSTAGARATGWCAPIWAGQQMRRDTVVGMAGKAGPPALARA
jgi:hypothetical protein